jgi:hypothetical protein
MIDWTTVRFGDPIESAVVGHRVWRYRLGPPLRLLSFCLGSSDVWLPGEVFSADKEPNMDCDRMAHGLHAFKTLGALRQHFRDLPGILRHRDIYEGSDNPARFDGVVRGTVILWGICIDHSHGYRAQFARPIGFDEAYGDRADVVLERLRRLFNCPSNP